MKKVIGVGLGVFVAWMSGGIVFAEVLPVHSDAAMLENSVRDLRGRHLYLKASQELVEYLAWHPGAEKAGRWLEEIQREEKAVLENPASSLAEHLYAEAYGHFFNGEPETVLQDWRTLMGLSLADLWGTDRISEVKEFSDRLEARLDGRRGLEALARGHWGVAEQLLDKSLKVIFNEEVSAGLEQARAQRLHEQQAGQARLKREQIEKLMSEGRLYYQKENWREARRSFEKVLKDDPSNGDARQYEALIEQASRGVFDPEKAREYYKEGLRAYHVGQLAQAKGLWETALRLDPTSNEIHTSLDRLAQEWK
jgi:tetratricopeptide (TPR) repeat protein